MINTVEKNYENGKWSSYKMILSDGRVWTVPLDKGNSDYQAIQEWIAEGGVVIDNGGGE